MLLYNYVLFNGYDVDMLYLKCLTPRGWLKWSWSWAWW